MSRLDSDVAIGVEPSPHEVKTVFTLKRRDVSKIILIFNEFEVCTTVIFEPYNS